MTLTCFERALSLATDETTADVWYNIGHVALVSHGKLSYGKLVHVTSVSIHMAGFPKGNKA
jgi:hypothetical protein